MAAGAACAVSCRSGILAKSSCSATPMAKARTTSFPSLAPSKDKRNAVDRRRGRKKGRQPKETFHRNKEMERSFQEVRRKIGSLEKEVEKRTISEKQSMSLKQQKPQQTRLQREIYPGKDIGQNVWLFTLFLFSMTLLSLRLCLQMMTSSGEPQSGKKPPSSTFFQRLGGKT